MSQQQIVLKIFEFVLLLFSLSLHEAAHAWTASRLGDQTARMLGRITLNPMKHIDPVGTVLLPLAMLFLFPFGGNFLVGWARPTPVNTRNFREYVRGDVLTTLAGPISNLLASVVCLLVLFVLLTVSPESKIVMRELIFAGFNFSAVQGGGLITPMLAILYLGLWLNLILAFFNLLPLPPLDGSHLVRHLLPTNALRVYDQLGIVFLIVIFFFGGRLIYVFVGPILGSINTMLLSI